MEDVTVLFNKTTRIHFERIPIVSTKILHTERDELALLSDKICEIYTFDRCPHWWSNQKSFLACGDAKKENWRTT